MNLVDNGFQLTGIKVKNDKIIFNIYLKCNSDLTKTVYFNNYYEGVYVELNSQKYNLFAVRSDKGLIAEMLYDTIVQNVSNGSNNIIRLWVRVRIGNTIIDQPVETYNDIVPLIFGHENTFYYTRISDYQFSVLKYTLKHLTENKIQSGHLNYDILCKSIIFLNKDIQLNVLISDSLRKILSEELTSNKLCLVWRDKKEKKSYYFHPQSVESNEFSYILSKEELLQFNCINSVDKIFEWNMADINNREYKIFCNTQKCFEKKRLPVKDYYAEFYISDMCLQMKMTNYIALKMCNTENDYVVFQYDKRSYSIEIIEIIAQRVNTDLEYSLPFEIFDEDENQIMFKVQLLFDENEEIFKKGVYQFWIIIRDGITEKKVLLKTYRNKKITENSYIIESHPYTIIGEHYYNCLFYNDSSLTLKCTIIPKIMKSEITKCFIKEGDIVWFLRICKEVFFDNNLKILLESENKKMITNNQFIVYEDTDFCEICVQMNMDCFCQEVGNGIIYPILSVDNRKGNMLILNNYNHNPISGRETQSFYSINETSHKDFKRIWGDYKKGAYVFGVSDDLHFCDLEEVTFDKGNMCILAHINEDVADFRNGEQVRVIIENILSEKMFSYSANINELNIAVQIDISQIKVADYIVYIEFSNGMKSNLAVNTELESFYDYEKEKKVLLQKKEGNLFISVQEMLLYENSQRLVECERIIEGAICDAEKLERKIWLVGENYGLSARDNGLAFFEYCMCRESLDADVYFVTKKDNADYKNLGAYQDHVVIYDSDEHIRMDTLAEYYIVSHGIRDVMPSLYHNKLGNYRKPVIYLQHGVTAMKINGISNKSYGQSIRKFVVCSEYEKNLLIKNNQFWDEDIIVTGFSRYDKLQATKKIEQNYIWLMPTWRDWLVASPDEFLHSEFYMLYCEILSNKKLLKKLHDNGCKLVFSLHIEFEKYKHFFEDLECDVVEITDMHQVDISDRIKECKMIVTDYSSIIFDVVYLKKPALFFQFDQDKYNVYRGSYVDLEKDLPGEVVHTSLELINALIRLIDNDFQVNSIYESNRKKYFDFEDCNNSERIYQAILELREEMADEY